MRAFVYCRVSTREQSTSDHYSLENQEQRGRDYAKMKKWQIVQLRKDVASGKNDERDGYQELLAAVRDEKVDVVIVYRLDRLSRNVRDIYNFLDDIRDAGVAFVSVTEGFDTTTAMGRAMLGVAAVFAQLTREMISENTKDGLLRRLESGLYNGNAKILNGYTYDSENGLLVQVPEEAEQIRQIFDWFCEHGWGTEKIARALNMRGSRAKSGSQWQSSTLRHILRNPVYCGQVRLENGTIEAKHEGIIALEQFDRTQELIRTRSSAFPPRTIDSKHLLSGLAFCGKCGRRLKSHTLVNAKSKKQYYFYHHGRSVKVEEQGDCRSFSKSAKLLESAVVGKIIAMAEGGAMKKLVIQDVKSRNSTDRLPRIKERDKMLLELNGLSEKFTQWAERLDAGKIDEEQFEEQNSRLLKRKKIIQELLPQIEQEVGEDENLAITLAEVKEALNDLPGVWDSLEYEEQRELLRLLIENIKVYSTHAELKLLFLDPVEVSLRDLRLKSE